MNIFQFLQVIWARRLVILASIAACLITALVVVQVVPPRYTAKADVMLNIIKPDPVTGQVIATSFLRAYTKTQIELVKSQQVANTVVTDLGWAENPELIKQYNERGSGDERSFAQWAAQRVIDGANARLIDASNILEISYTSKNPVLAKQVADALSRAYERYTLEERRDTARRNAEWYEAQAKLTKAELLTAENARSEFEREHGILLQDNNTDLDSAQLAALAAAASAPVISAPLGPSPLVGQLAQLDAEIAEATKSLGPNHPKFQELQQRRKLLAAQVAADRQGGGGSAAAQQAAASMFEKQKSRVMAQRETVERLRLLQTDVELKRNQYTRAATRAAELRQEANVADAGVTPLGAATTPLAPEFPNKPLILGGSLGVGAALGLVLALALELIMRRVRGPEDLRNALDAPLLGIVSFSTGPSHRNLLLRVRTRMALLNRETRVA